MTVSNCKHQGNWPQIDRYCVQCVEDLEKKFEVVVNTLQVIAANDPMFMTPQEMAEHTLDELNES